MTTKHFRATTQTSIPLFDLYDRLATITLRKILTGFEFQFDKVHEGAFGYPSADWLSRRISLISQLLEGRSVVLKPAPSAMDKMRIILKNHPQACTITRWSKANSLTQSHT